MPKKIRNTECERFPSALQARDRATLWDSEVRGFGLRYFEKTKTKVFILVFRVKGTAQQRLITIGRYLDPWKVDQARARALELKARMVTGHDPVEEERQRLKAKRRQAVLDAALSTTLQQVMESYLLNKTTKHGRPLRSKTKADIRRHCETNLAHLLDQPVSEINRDVCLKVFDKITERGAPAQAGQCMVYLRALLNHARIMHEQPDGSFPVLPMNPVTALFRLRKPKAAKPRRRRVPLNRIGHVWNLLRTRAASARKDHERTAADLVSTLLLTGWRLTETAALKRSDVNLDARTITLRGDVEDATDGFEGTKTHVTATLPMSDTLHEILSARINAPEDNTPAARRRRRARSSEYVFPSFGRKRPYLVQARTAMKAVSEVAGCTVSPHDLRRTAEDIAKAVRVDADDRRKLLSHVGGDTHAVHYDNSADPEALRDAVNRISNFVIDASRVASAQESGANVVAFPGKSA